MNCRFCQAENDESADVCRKCGRGLYALVDGSLLSGRYEILQPLGKGGMGLVYKAHDRDLRETVAIKVLRSQSQSPELFRRFRSEIRFARRVRHPNVCAIHEFGQDGHLRFIVMEYVDGVDLKRLLRRQGPFPPAQAFDTVIQAARGLEAIHSASIVHRDLKTANIMRDGRGVVRLMDFGIAKQFEGDSGTGATMTGQVLGTPEYMSPEQARGHEVDLRTDIYALGVVLYELLTGDVPFRGETPVATLLMHLEEPPALAGPKAVLIPPFAVPVLECGLAKVRDDRYGSARAMLFALQEALVPPPGSSTLLSASPTASAAALIREAPQTLTRPPTPVPTSVPLGSPLAAVETSTWAKGPTPATTRRAGARATAVSAAAVAAALVLLGVWIYAEKAPGTPPLTSARTSTPPLPIESPESSPAPVALPAARLPGPSRPVPSVVPSAAAGPALAVSQSTASEGPSKKLPAPAPNDEGSVRSQEASETLPVPAATTPLSAPATTPLEASAPLLTSAPSPAAPERGPIESVLERYRLAIEGKDLVSLKQVWPDMPSAIERTIREGFRFSQSHRVELRLQELAVSTDLATATCARRDEILSKDGQRLHHTSTARFTLHKNGTAWLIQAIN